MSTQDPIKQAWQASAADAALPPLAEVRAGADRFYRRVRRRNLVEYSAAAFVILAFAVQAVILPFVAMRVGAVAVVIGTLIVVWQLYRSASAEPPPEAAATLPILAHTRAQLARQQRALSRVAIWYLGPLVPGMAILLLAPIFGHGRTAPLAIQGNQLFAIGVAVLIFVGVWWLNQLGARKLGAAIAEIDALTGPG